LHRLALDFLTNAGACTTVEALDGEFARLTRAWGFKSAALIRLLTVGEPVAPKIVFGNAPDDWVERYIEQEYGGLDPTLPVVFQSRQAFTWDRVETLHRSREVRTFFGEARELFAQDSFIVPVWGPWGELSVVNLASDEAVDLGPEERAMLQGLCSLYASIGLGLADPALPAVPDEAKRLGRRELQCVYWTAMGKHDPEIAVILDISPLTVRAYLDAAREKLGVTTRPELIRKALTLGLLLPDRAMMR
jgi:DNA-binding CsgD family transcriptional regulator